jgi:hypothetical protein
MNSMRPERVSAPRSPHFFRWSAVRVGVKQGAFLRLLKDQRRLGGESAWGHSPPLLLPAPLWVSALPWQPATWTFFPHPPRGPRPSDTSWRPGVTMATGRLLTSYKHLQRAFAVTGLRPFRRASRILHHGNPMPAVEPLHP